MMKLPILFILIACIAGCVTLSGSEPNHAQNSAKLRTDLAAEYYSRAQYGVALDELQKALHIDSRYAPAYGVRALVHMALHEDKEAEEDFLTSLRLDTVNSESHSNYGWFLCQHGRESESVKQFMAALKNPLYATPEKAYLNAGVCSRKAGELKDAEEFLQRALYYRPEMPEAQLELAELEFTKGDYAAAKSAFSHYARSAADNLTAANLWLGVRIERMRGNSSAEEIYAMQLRNRYPDSRETQLLLQAQ